MSRKHPATSGVSQVDVPAWQRLCDFRQDTHNDKKGSSRGSIGIGMWHGGLAIAFVEQNAHRPETAKNCQIS